ncbi:MAG: tRNA methyltransferase, partial [Candidatus Ranarchaeia archaeon]
MNITAGSYVFVYQSPSQNWLVKVDPKRKFFTNEGPIDLASIIGKPYGTRVLLNNKHSCILLKPTPR